MLEAKQAVEAEAAQTLTIHITNALGSQKPESLVKSDRLCVDTRGSGVSMAVLLASASHVLTSGFSRAVSSIHTLHPGSVIMFRFFLLAFQASDFQTSQTLQAHDASGPVTLSSLADRVPKIVFRCSRYHPHQC